MLIQENLSIEEKLRILSDAAKYDAACTSSGVGRKGKEGLSWKQPGGRHLPQFCLGWALYLPAENFIYEPVHL